MAETFQIKRGDLLPALQADLTDEDGVAIDLTSATSVDFRFERRGFTSNDVTKPAVVLDAAKGKVEYQWQQGDTDLSGPYDGEFIANFGTKKQTFPSGVDDFIDFDIAESLLTNDINPTPATPAEDPETFQHPWIVGTSNEIIIPAPGAQNSTYMVIAVISKKVGGVVGILSLADSPVPERLKFTLDSDISLPTGTIIDIKIIDISS